MFYLRILYASKRYEYKTQKNITGYWEQENSWKQSCIEIIKTLRQLLSKSLSYTHIDKFYIFCELDDSMLWGTT